MELQQKSALLACLVSLCFALTIAQSAKQPIGKLIIFDPESNQEIVPVDFAQKQKADPEMKTRTSFAASIMKYLPLPQLWNPCKCNNMSCNCCIGLRFSYTNSSKNGMCFSLTNKRPKLDVNIRVDVNNFTVFDRDIIGDDIPACTPIPLLGLPLVGCLRIYQLRNQENGNIEFCVSLDLKIIITTMFGYKFGCFRFGSNGVETFVDTNPTTGSSWFG